MVQNRCRPHESRKRAKDGLSSISNSLLRSGTVAGPSVFHQPTWEKAATPPAKVTFWKGGEVALLGIGRLPTTRTDPRTTERALSKPPAFPCPGARHSKISAPFVRTGLRSPRSTGENQAKVPGRFTQPHDCLIWLQQGPHLLGHTRKIPSSPRFTGVCLYRECAGLAPPWVAVSEGSPPFLPRWFKKHRQPTLPRELFPTAKSIRLQTY